MHEGEVYFYSQNSQFNWDSVTGVAISSQEKDGTSPVEVWEVAQQDLEASYSGFKWEKEEQVSVGNYLGARYHFWNRKMKGDCIIWETENRLYKCVMTAEKKEYQDTIDLLLESLKTFKVPSEEKIN